MMAALFSEYGTVGRNPQPLSVLGNDAVTVIHYLRRMDVLQIRRLGGELGLDIFNLQKMQILPDDMVRAWLRREDRVMEKCGSKPLSWEILVEALQRVGQTGIADDILRDKCSNSGSHMHMCTDLIPNSGRSVVPQDPIQRYAMYLKGVYKNALVCLDKFPNLTCNKFINLALVKSARINPSEADEFTKATLHGHVDKILKKKEPITLEDVLKPVKGQLDMKCVYMYGAPGVGKSTCAGELCRRWDEIESLKRYSLVILLRLREKRVQEAQNVKDLCFHDNEEVCQAVAAKIAACEGKGVLFILDGFDELPASLQKCSIFTKLIRGTFLSHCTVLVTSRPSATADLYRARPLMNKEIEVIGFTQEHIEQYAKAVFASQPDILADFLMYISTNPAVRSLMYIPLNCAVAVEIYRHNRKANRPIPQTMTQLYTELSLVLLQRHLGEDDPLIDQFSDRLDCLPKQLYEPFCLLAEQAFEGLTKNEVIFHNSVAHFGFMNSPTELYMGKKASVSHSFLHLTLQEFLAAFHISQLTPSDQKKMFKKYIHWNVVWRFVAGLTGFHGIRWIDVRQVNTKSYKGNFENRLITSFLVQCLYEAQEKVDIDSVLGDSVVLISDNSSLFQQNLTALDCYAVGYCMVNSKCVWELRFWESSLGDTLVKMLKLGLSNPIERHVNIHLLTLSHCRLTSTGLNLLADIVPLMTNLKDLDISFSKPDDGGFVKLFHSLKTHVPCLESLLLFETNFSCTDVEGLSGLISHSSSLKKLEIGLQHSSTNDCTKLLLETVLLPSSLQTLKLDGLRLMQWTDKAVGLLQENNNLTELTLPSSSSVGAALGKNSCVTNLTVSTNIVPNKGLDLRALTEIICSNRTLETLQIRDSHITQDDIILLSTALQSNPTLKTVQITCPSIYDFNLPSKINKRIHIMTNKSTLDLRPRVAIEVSSSDQYRLVY